MVACLDCVDQTSETTPTVEGCCDMAECCCGERFKTFFLLIGLVFGIGDLVLDWIAFGSFAADGFITSPMGDPDNNLLIAWSSVIALSTIIAAVDLLVIVWTLAGLMTKRQNKKDVTGTDNIALTWQHFLSGCRVIIEDGGNFAMTFYIFAATCRLKTSTTTGSDFQVKYWTLMASLIASGLSALFTLFRLCRAACVCCGRCNSRNYAVGKLRSKLLCALGGFVIFLTFVGCTSFFAVQTINYLGGQTEVANSLVDGDEASIYIKPQDSDSSLHTFLVNFSDIYSSQGKESIV
ncbi:uncharacterized protein LOC134189687 isoform X2 [Corticium candelabrum]|uniref:uncharacterized protein LOC134189687 isoform X2 n=1 Tax=Corticium candelabrum TaxID=121492 RepID=UPI002E25CE4D|nr:uncharacterized protein LOC134189687 isoform X2 [Corticium candelabrum]